MADLTASEEVLAGRNLAIDDCLSRADAAGLAQYLAEDFRYTHSTGMKQTRQEYLDAYSARKDPPLRRLSDTVVELHEDVAVTQGSIDVIFSDQRPTLLMRYVRVWRLIGGQWMAISQRTVPAIDRA